MDHKLDLPFRKASAHVPEVLPEFFCFWDEIRREDVQVYLRCLNSAASERALQAFFEANSILLIQHLGGGHGRWVIPHKRLGSELTTDFVIGERSSYGFEWQAVELESPRAQLFTKKGDPASALNHAIRQIMDWRTWLKSNRDYAVRPPESQGLGLTDIDSSIKGLILIGREACLDPSTRDRRRQLVLEHKIDIHTYDWVARNSLGRIETLKSQRRGRQDH